MSVYDTSRVTRLTFQCCQNPGTSALVLLLLGALVLGPERARSADIPVAAGGGTLQTAINNANAGDTLLLADGVYTHSGDISITKSLIIRAASKAANPVILNETRVNASPVVLQGLEFNGMPLRAADSGAANGSLYVLENNFVESPILDGSGTLNRLFVIGNRFSGSANLGVGARVNNVIYIAANEVAMGSGNSFSWNIGFGLPSCYFVGNRITATLADEGFLLSTGPPCRIMANRFEVRLDTTYSTDVDVLPVVSVNDTSYIRNNLFKLIDVSGLGAGSIVAGLNMVKAGGNADSSRIENNVFDLSGLALSPDAATRDGVVETGSGITVQGNIFTSSDQPWFTGGVGPLDLSSFNSNLCFDNVNDACPAGDGNLNADPQFVDTIDYQLAGGSPAIDAGPDLAGLIDVDGTRADMGIHGGAFPIGQYDVQREDTTSAPYVFPRFDAGRDVNVVGLLPIDVIAFARIR